MQKFKHKYELMARRLSQVTQNIHFHTQTVEKALSLMTICQLVLFILPLYTKIRVWTEPLRITNNICMENTIHRDLNKDFLYMLEYQTQFFQKL